MNTTIIKPTKGGIPNFYIQPNGVFYVTYNKEVGICKTSDYKKISNVKFATQSGPMLLINGAINQAFDPKSHNYQIRNGVGILPSGDLIFAISQNRVSFYEFAIFFKKNGCKEALYLDGYVSKVYLPEKKIEMLSGDLGVIIGVTKKI